MRRSAAAISHAGVVRDMRADPAWRRPLQIVKDQRERTVIGERRQERAHRFIEPQSRLLWREWIAAWHVSQTRSQFREERSRESLPCLRPDCATHREASRAHAGRGPRERGDKAACLRPRKLRRAARGRLRMWRARRMRRAGVSCRFPALPRPGRCPPARSLRSQIVSRARRSRATARPEGRAPVADCSIIGAPPPVSDLVCLLQFRTCLEHARAERSVAVGREQDHCAVGSATPSVRTSERKPAMRRGGKLTTPITRRPTRSSGAIERGELRAGLLDADLGAEVDAQLVGGLARALQGSAERTRPTRISTFSKSSMVISGVLGMQCFSPPNVSALVCRIVARGSAPRTRQLCCEAARYDKR